MSRGKRIHRFDQHDAVYVEHAGIGKCLKELKVRIGNRATQDFWKAIEGSWTERISGNERCVLQRPELSKGNSHLGSSYLLRLASKRPLQVVQDTWSSIAPSGVSSKAADCATDDASYDRANWAEHGVHHGPDLRARRTHGPSKLSR